MLVKRSLRRLIMRAGKVGIRWGRRNCKSKKGELFLSLSQQTFSPLFSLRFGEANFVSA